MIITKNKYKTTIENGADEANAGGGGGQSTPDTQTNNAPPDKRSFATDSQNDIPNANAASDTFADLNDDNKKYITDKGYKDYNALVKSAKEAEKLIGKKGIIPPTQDASTADIEAYNKAMGVPFEADKGYEGFPNEFEFSGDLAENEQYQKNFKEGMTALHDFMIKAGVPARNAPALAKMLGEHDMAQNQQAIIARDTEAKKVYAQFQIDAGRHLDQRLENATYIRDAYGGEAFSNIDLEKNPEFLVLFSNIGQQLSEHRFQGGNSNSSPTLESATETYQKYVSDNREAYLDTHHADHVRVSREAEDLLNRSVDLQMKSKR